MFVSLLYFYLIVTYMQKMFWSGVLFKTFLIFKKVFVQKRVLPENKTAKGS